MHDIAATDMPNKRNIVSPKSTSIFIEALSLAIFLDF